MRRILVAVLCIAAAIGCAAPSPTARTPVASSQSIGGLNTAGTPLPTVALGGVGGKIVFAREGKLVAMEAGRTSTIVQAPAGAVIRAPAWSPDGGSVAYALSPPRGTPRAGRPSLAELPTSDIMVASADGSGQRVLVAHDGPGGQLESPAWLPDGRGLLYGYYRPIYNGEQFVEDRIEIRRLDLASGVSTTVTRGASNPAVSPDGRQVAYIGEDTTQGPSLRVAAIDGGAERLLTKPNTFQQMQAPAFSPDGQTIVVSAVVIPRAQATDSSAAFWSKVDHIRGLLTPIRAEAHGNPWEIWIVPVAGGSPRQVTQIGEDEPVARWSADGGRLLVLGAGGLYVIDMRASVTYFASTEGGSLGLDWRS